MHDIINILPDSVANQIAAGEVIQRPASVIKELVENSCDAGSTNITVNVCDGGRTLVQVIDNGSGMSETDARLSFERHATSKIINASDLFAISTLGFRGEALASIAAVAEVTLVTKREEDSAGTKIVVRGTEVIEQTQTAANTGSNFMIRNLFFNVPARRKFLKTDQVELRNIINEFQRIALCHPEIEFTLTHNNTEIYRLPKSNHKQRIIHMFGKGMNQNLAHVETDTSIVVVSGFIGKPDAAKKKMGEQFFFINGRYMRHPYFHKAVMTVFESLVVPGSIPAYFLYLETDPAAIDVNIHPTKTEIKFDNEEAIFKILQAAVKESVGRFSFSPSIDFDTSGKIEMPFLSNNTEIKHPTININPDFNPFDNEQAYNRPSPAPLQKDNMREWDRLYEGFEKAGTLPLEDKPKQEQQLIDAPATSKFMQFRNKYILTTVKSGLMVIDQKRAHERILFEQFCETYSNEENPSQHELFPVTLELSADDYNLVIEIKDNINKLGFEIEDFGNRNIIINACPVELKGHDPKELLESLIEEYKQSQGTTKLAAQEKIPASLAAASSIRYGQTLTAEEMKYITDKLFACKITGYSPSGKKIFMITPTEDIIIR